MREFTGCEDRINSYTTTVVPDTTTTTVVPDTTTTTVVPDTTTTTVVPANSSETNNNYGIIPSISLSSNEVVSLFKGIENSDSVCGTPYLGLQNTGISNLYSNGSVPSTLNVINGSFSQSSNSTEILRKTVMKLK